MSYPIMREDIDFIGGLDGGVAELQQRLSEHRARVVDQHVHFTHLE